MSGAKDGEDEQHGAAEDDRHRVGKRSGSAGCGNTPAGKRLGMGTGLVPGPTSGVPSLTPRLRAPESKRVDRGLAQEVAALGLVLEAELMAFQDDVVGLQAGWGEHHVSDGQVSDRLSGGHAVGCSGTAGTAGGLPGVARLMCARHSTQKEWQQSSTLGVWNVLLKGFQQTGHSGSRPCCSAILRPDTGGV